jgi:diguanylate cyclase (GGDEF)-like protein
MEALLSKIKDAGLDATSVSGEEAIIFWHHVRLHVATDALEQAQCYIISAEYRAESRQNQASIEELILALRLLQLPEDAELVLSVRNSLSQRYVDSGDFHSALNEYIATSNIAVEQGFIDDYALSILGMGNLCSAYGDENQALRFYQKIDSIDHAISSRELRLKSKLAMLNCYIALNRFSAAENMIDECEELSILVSDKTLTGKIQLYQARLYAHQDQLQQALAVLSNISYNANGAYSLALSSHIRIELACCFLKLDRPEIAEMILRHRERKIKPYLHPVIAKEIYQTLSLVYEYQGHYKYALNYEKKAFRVESDLMKRVPIGELGTNQLRRLSRFELQLKLILSEIENRELKETTETQKNTVAQLQQDVFTDPLTKLHNRRWLDAKLKDLLLRDTSFAFLVIDIDHFKSINDELSHLVGDKAIVNVSSELAAYFKIKDSYCVRFGGEEFLVILENASLEQATLHADNFRQRIYQFPWHDILGERGLTVSVGVTLHRDGENTQRTFYRADKALYRAKANGRNQVCSE